jgi:short-subunit dehydrogenase
VIANTASISGKHGQGLHKELSNEGIQVTALCPGFVATDMTDWIEDQVPKDEMIQPEDIAEAIRFVLRTSAHCVVPEIQFIRSGDSEV